MNGAITRAKRRAAERRVRIDSAGHAYGTFLERAAIPVFRQVANILRAEGYAFEISTPAGSVRLSDRAPDDYIELTFDTAMDEPAVIGRSSRRRGHRVAQSETALGDPASLTEDDVLTFVLKELEAFVER